MNIYIDKYFFLNVVLSGGRVTLPRLNRLREWSLPFMPHIITSYLPSRYEPCQSTAVVGSKLEHRCRIRN